MTTIRYRHWKQDNFWIGYLEDFSDYWTQGTTREELIDRLKDLYENRDLMDSTRTPVAHAPGSPGEFTL